MAVAYIDGQPADLPEALGEASRLLDRAQLPIVAGLAADVAGIRAAIRLARRIGGVFDHLASDALLDQLAVMRDAGWMSVSPAELRRADLILVVGDAPPWIDRMAGGGHHVICIGAPSAAKRLAQAGLSVEALAASRAELPGVVAALRARAAGRPVSPAPKVRKLAAVAERLRSAKFGIAVWSAGLLDRLTMEMLCGLVKDLNDTTRFSGLPLPAPDNGSGAAQVSGWMTGFPMRTGFSRGRPEHDPWRYDAHRLAASGEADLALWISAYRPVEPGFDGIDLIAIAAPGTRFRKTPRVQVEVGMPGIDHDAVEHSGETGTLASRPARAPSDRPSAGQVLEGILARLPEEGAPS